YLPCPVNLEPADGKMKVGPRARSQFPECAGESNSTSTMSPKDVVCRSPPEDVGRGTLLYSGMTGRLIRFQSSLRLMGSTGWKSMLLTQWPFSRMKLLNWKVRDQMLLIGFVSLRLISLRDCSSSSDPSERASGCSYSSVP